MKRSRRLTLNRETVRALAVPDLRRAAGAAEPTGSAGNACGTVYTAAMPCPFVTEQSC